MHKQRLLTLLLVLGALFAGVRHLAAQNESLLIGSGDLVQIDVMDTPEMEQQVRVTDAGTIDLAYIGSVHVAGMPPAVAAAEIRAQLVAKNVMRDPQVIMRVVEYSTQNVSVLGEVHAPGSYPLTTPQSVLKVVALAGGLSDDADRHISIKKPGQKEIVYYLSNDSTQALASVVMVQPGDTVLIPRAPRVYIAGDVSRPGSYAIATNNSELTVLQALTAAGSPNKTAVKHVRLIRPNPEGGQPTEIPVNLAQIEKGKEPDVTMLPDDVLYVPFSWTKNLAVGSASIVAATTSGALYVVR